MIKYFVVKSLTSNFCLIFTIPHRIANIAKRKFYRKSNVDKVEQKKA